MISYTDILLARLAFYLPEIPIFAGQLENIIYRKDVKQHKILKPVYVCGLARSGTTIILESLIQAKGAASHQYRDFPFLFSPVFWNKFQELFSKKQNIEERIHKDNIFITSKSPEAQEEPLWQYFFPYTHNPEKLHVLNKNTVHTSFESFYRTHIKKILYIRQAERYISKGNYNISRIEYLKKILPDAHFILMIRHPFEHIASLVKQHNHFEDYATKYLYFSEYLRYSGHYEFGPQRLPINFSKKTAKNILEAWKNNSHHIGYAYMWRDIYNYVHQLLNNEHLNPAIHLLPFETLCKKPEETLSTLFQTLELTPHSTINQISTTIKKPPSHSSFFNSKQKSEIWAIVGPVAASHNYGTVKLFT